MVLSKEEKEQGKGRVIEVSSRAKEVTRGGSGFETETKRGWKTVRSQEETRGQRDMDMREEKVDSNLIYKSILSYESKLSSESN